MTPNEFVKLYMQNCQYGNELSLMAAGIAEENGLVVVFGASDDLCEVRGAVDDEIDCFDGGKTIIAGAKVKINWCKNGYSWTYDTDIPHECFDVYENGEKYCRGIVFSISDVRLPTADVRPERHGKWNTGYFHDRVCSCCLHPDNDLGDYAHNYCPNCGAKIGVE